MFDWNKIIIPFISTLFLFFFFSGLRKIISWAGLNRKYKDKNNIGSGLKIAGAIITGYSRSKKLSLVILFSILTALFYILFRNIFLSLFVGISIEIFIFDIFNGLEEKKRVLLHEQLIEFINNMILMLKAGKTVRSTIKGSVGLFKNPLNSFIKVIANELELNSTFEEALDRFSESCRSREVFLFVSALKINGKIGGDLAFILDKIAETLRHSLEVKSQLATFSLQSRYSGNVIALLPIIVLILLFIFMNNTMQAFFSTTFGTILLFSGGVLEISGIAIMKKIINITG